MSIESIEKEMNHLADLSHFAKYPEGVLIKLWNLNRVVLAMRKYDDQRMYV